MGAYAEYLAVKAAAITRKPSNLSFEEAASVPVASQTAWQGIFTHGHLEKGQTILIHGGAGAVGAYAVQSPTRHRAPSWHSHSFASRRLRDIGARFCFVEKTFPDQLFEQHLASRNIYVPEATCLRHG